MANAIKWTAPSSTTVLSTELNSLAANTMSSLGTEYDNATNKNQYGILELTIDVFASAPTANRAIELFMVVAPDGTNYETTPTTTTQACRRITVAPVFANTSIQRFVSERFDLPPMKQKYCAWNRTDQALDAAGHTVKLYTFNDEIQ